MRFLLFTLSLSFLMTSLHAQMTIDGNTLYGNEWINHSQNYYKCYVTEDGMYRISTQTLTDAGVPVGAIQAGDFQLYVLGNPVPIHVSTSGALGADDYVEFYGKKNRGELDVHLYAQPDDLFNPYYSMFTDSTAYFLTWENAVTQFQDTPNDLTALPPAESFFMDEQLLVYNDRYHKGEPTTVSELFYAELFESRYTEGEGFGTRLNQVTSGTLYTPYAYTASAADAVINIKFAASSATDHYTQLTLNGTAIPLSASNFSGYDVIDLSENFSANLLSSGIADIQLRGLLGSNDSYSTAFAKITYPRQFNFDNQDEYHFKIVADAAKKYLEITNFNHGGTAPVLYDLTNNLRIETNLNGNIVRIALPPSATERELLLISQNNYQNITDLDAVNFVDYTTTQGDYIIISHPTLFDDGAGNNYVQQYADYRASTGFTPIIITDEQLYDQFAYGISKHTQSVRNLTGYMLDNWTVSPRYMFMIGKSRPHYSVRERWQTGQPAYTLTFGNEPSDMLLTATNTSDVPRLAFGKLPVTNPDQIRIYLDKVMAHENLNLAQTIEDRTWQKRILHLGGGDTVIAQDLIEGLKEYEAIAEDEFFGADVTTFSAANLEPSEYSSTILLDSLMNEGASMITFFGHSTPMNIDFNIRDVDEYSNINRYHLFLSLGAYSGQIHTKSFGMSEQFIFEENKGSITFMGMTSLAGVDVYGVIEQSNFFNEVFYQKLSKDNYGEGIGDIHRAAVAAVADDADVLKRMVYQQMTLNGDPAVRLHAAPAPDYLVNTSTSDITFAPDTPATDDALELTFNIFNLGKAENQPVKVLVERVLPNGDVVIVVNETVDAPSFEEEYTFDIPAVADAVGTNEFIITLDSDDLIVELPNPDAEGNNTATASIFILDGIVKPVSPINYGIETDANTITLQAEINDRYANQSLNYIIQIDTTELFDSPLKIETTITQTGGILEWSPPVNYVNETVYYWRVKAITGQVPNAEDWQNHSFIYLDGESPGWNQSHHYQFLDDTYDNSLLYNENTRKFEYRAGGIEVEVDNAHTNVLPWTDIDFSIAGTRIYDVEACEQHRAGIYVVLIDENAEPIQNEAVDLTNNVGQYGSFICRSTQPAFTFPTEDAAGQQVLIDFLNNTLPTLSNVSNVLIYTLNDYLPETWSPALFSAFANYGITELQNSASLGGVPYAALIDLENNATQEMISNSESDILEAIFFIRDVWTQGSMTSTVIGPALEWASLQWNTMSETGDNAHINVYGIDDNGQRTLLVEDITTNNHLFNTDVVDADAYPYLQLEYVTTDATNQTPPQLDFWRVLYRPNPCYELKLTVLLEGAYDVNAGAMRTDLSLSRKILPGQTPVSPLVNPTPAGQPYSVAPWNYNGVEGLDFTDSDYQGNEVDWVLVGLRIGIQKADEVSQAAGLLMKDGTIRFPAECPVRTDEPGPFFVVVEHRNHMAAMSTETISPTDRELIMDFTTQDSYTGFLGWGQSEVAPGKWAMIAGDLDQTIDDFSYDVNGGDKIEWEIGNGNFDTYRTSDANLNGDTNGEDKIIWELNNGKFSRVPR